MKVFQLHEKLARSFRPSASRNYPRVTTAGGFRRSGVVAVLDDPRELVRVEAGPADERAVDVWLAHQLGDVRRLHRSAVLDADRLGGGAVVDLGDTGANGR